METVQNKRFRYLSISVIRNTFISSTVMAIHINKCNCLSLDLLSSVGQFLSLKQKYPDVTFCENHCSKQY